LHIGAKIGTLRRGGVEGSMRVLMVCLGNICRSPLAQGVAEARAAAANLAVAVDSAGTAGWHQGSPPDPRAIAAAARRGLDIAAQRARRVAPDDFRRFDLLCAMDTRVKATLDAMRPADATARVTLLMDFAAGSTLRTVPDPYYEDDAAFDIVLDLIEQAVAGLLAPAIDR
jgi:protein-tyrosine phosphatase